LQTAASPLDQRIDAFTQSPAEQDQRAVAEILRLGVQEHRSAEALAAVQPWLNRYSLTTGEGLFHAGQAAERAGKWLDAIGYYQRYLATDKLNAKQAGIAADSAYFLLLNIVADQNVAYEFMRKDGNHIRSFGQAKRYDTWFLEQAQKRRDLIAVIHRLATIVADKASHPDHHQAAFEWLCTELEQFRKEPDEVYEAAHALAKAKRTPNDARVRLRWVSTVMPYNQKLDKLLDSKTPADSTLTDVPMAAARDLIQQMPSRGPLLVAKGWGTDYDAHHGRCAARFEIEGERKLKQLLDAVPNISSDMRDDFFAYPLARGRVRYQAIDIWSAVAKHPETFNRLDVTRIPFFDKTALTVQQAKALAPHLARNPHAEAAMIRSIAISESLEVVEIIEAMAATESWRFKDTNELVDAAWKASTTQSVSQKDLQASYVNLAPKVQRLKKQIAEDANSKDRIAAFRTIYKDLQKDAPTIPMSLAMWQEVFENAPDSDLVEMIKVMVADTEGVRGLLLKRALPHASFGPKNAGKMHWQASVYDNQFRYHRTPVQQSVPQLIAYLQQRIEKQAIANDIDPLVFGMWLHTVDPKADDAIKLIEKLKVLPAYANLDEAYRRSVADRNHFGREMATAELLADDPLYISRELLALPQDAAPKQIESAFTAVVKRVASRPEPIAVLGLQPVAALPEWNEDTYQRVLSLFKDNAPLGDYPSKQGYEPLIERLVDEAIEQGRYKHLEPYLVGLWHAAYAKDHHVYEGVPRLIRLAEAALKSGDLSFALSISRAGESSRIGQKLRSSTDERYKQWFGKLSQAQGKASIALGIIDIPVDELDPAFSIYKSQAEFALGNLDAAWELYDKHDEQLLPVVRELTVPYCLWLLEREIESRQSNRAEALIKELTVWSRQQAGVFSATQEGELKIAYADAAFQRGALQTSKAWYRRVADAEEFKGQPLQYEAQLRSVRVDRASNDFASALAELDKLMRVPDRDLRTKVHFARAEVFYDQQRYADAFNEASRVLKREPNHPDALILLGEAQLEMRKLVDASEIELGISQDQKLIVPGEVIKINLSDPALNVSGVGADIEVEVWTKSGDRERVLLYQLGDDKTKFRAEIPTILGKRQPGDKVLQLLGRDEIRYGYSKRFREKMADLPADPEIVITVASDATMSASAGAFPPREGERRLDLSELGVSSAQQALGTRRVRPGNPVYLRISDPDQSKTDGIDQIAVSIETTSGDMIPRLVLNETTPHSGEFEAAIPTGPAQALAFASESTPGRDANMVISAADYPGWSGVIGSSADHQFFTIDLNDNVALGTMQIDSGGPAQAITHFVLQTSLNGKEWTSVARYPASAAPWSGKPQLTAFPTYNRNSIAITTPEGREVPDDWRDKMEIGSAAPGINYAAFSVSNLTDMNLDLPSGGHPSYSVLVRYRANFHQPVTAMRTFKLQGLPITDKAQTLFLINGKPASNDSSDALTITRELQPGLHTIEVWRHESRSELLKRKPQILHDTGDGQTLSPCPDAMFDPNTFPESVQPSIARPTSISATGDRPGVFEVDFGEHTRSRLVRLAIVGHQGPTPSLKSISLTDADGTTRLPVTQDFNELRANRQLEVVPGDRITVRYEDDRVVSERRAIQQRSLSVAYNTATIAASFLTYEMNELGERELVIEPIRRFKMDDSVGIVVNDPDLDQMPQRDELTLKVQSSSGQSMQVIALETGNHTGVFLGKVFPVTGVPSRESEIQVPPGGTITAVYRDEENLDPGIPTDRVVTVEHARFGTPTLSVYDTASATLSETKSENSEKLEEPDRGPEVVKPRRSLAFVHAGHEPQSDELPKAVIGSSLRFDVVASHLAFAQSSEVVAYVQTESGRNNYRANGKTTGSQVFDIRVPGTLRLLAQPSRTSSINEPDGYRLSGAAQPPHNRPPLDEGRFAFSVPVQLDLTPSQSFATADAQTLPRAMLPDYLAVRPDDIVHIGFAYLDKQGKPRWLTARASLASHALIDVMNSRYREERTAAFVGEKLFVRVIDPDRDRSSQRDELSVTLKTKSGLSVPYTLQETEVHSGVFKGSLKLTYASEATSAKLPSIALHGLPVKYGDIVSVQYKDGDDSTLDWTVGVNKGADGTIEPFTKQFGEGEVAVQTTFTLAECYFELAKHHRKMEQDSLARRQMGHAQKLLAEAVATHRDEDLQAQAEYLLGNLAQEYADLAQNTASKERMYQDALARFAKIPLDYPDSEFAPKAQFKKGLVYEKLGELDTAVEEYVKLAYKYPEHELIPSVMSRLGSYFQAQGKAYKGRAEVLEQNIDDVEAQGEALKLREKMSSEYRNAAQVFKKLQDRFPNDALAGLAGLRSAQNFLRAGDYKKAIAGFQFVIDQENYDGKTIRSQAMFWAGISHERLSEQRDAYQLYRRTTFDFPDSVWAKQARGRLADPVFADIIAAEQKAREMMLEALKEK
jgi:tetratricopeptide (TPR) repeat protein